MGRKAQERVTVGLMVRTRRDNSDANKYFHIDLYPVKVEQGNVRLQIRNFTTTSFGENDINGVGTLANLYIESQGDKSTQAERGLYGWQVRFKDAYSVDLRAAKAMVKTLTRVDTKLKQMSEKLGPAGSYSEFVLRIAAILKVTYIIETVQAGSFYSEGEYAFHDLDYGRRLIDKFEQDWKNEAKDLTPA